MCAGRRTECRLPGDVLAGGWCLAPNASCGGAEESEGPAGNFGIKPVPLGSFAMAVKIRPAMADGAAFEQCRPPS
jgi:hypothetical protein